MSQQQQLPPDHLTSLQASLDQLATQMYASLFYTSHRSALSRIPGQAYQGVDPISFSSSSATVASAAPQPNASSPIAAGHEAAAAVAGAAAAQRPGSPLPPPPPQTPSSQPQSLAAAQQSQGTGATGGGDASAAAAAAEEDNMERPDSPDTFRASLTELSRDLVRKVLHIEGLVKSLPGTQRTRDEQETKLRELDEETRRVEVELARARREKEGLLEKIEGRLVGVSRW